jgi:hypothetical protein
MRRASAHVLVLMTSAALLGLSASPVAASSASGEHAVATTASSAHSTLFGVTVGSTGILKQDTAEFGHLPIIHVFYPGLPGSWTRGVLAAAKSAVVLSFNAKPSAILSGADNAKLSHFFDTAPTGHPIYYNFVHEPEDNIARGQFSAASYRAAWAHIVRLADAAHNSDLHSTLVLMSYDLRPGSHRDWRNYLPGGGIINVLAWDGYPAGAAGSHSKGLQLTPPAQFLGPDIAVAKAAGMRFGFAEFGTPLVHGRAAWLTSVGSYLKSSGALFGTYFDSAPPLPSMRLHDSASITAWRHVVAQSGNDGTSHGTVPSIVASPGLAAPPAAGTAAVRAWRKRV